MYASGETQLVFDKDIILNKNSYIYLNISNERLIFILIYNRSALVGTTDDIQEIELNPFPKKDQEFLKFEIKRLSVDNSDFDKPQTPWKHYLIENIIIYNSIKDTGYLNMISQFWSKFSFVELSDKYNFFSIKWVEELNNEFALISMNIHM